jgi:Fe-S-cluster containining protein
MPADFSRQEPRFFSCFDDPAVRALCARMMVLASEIKTDVALYADAFRETLRFPARVFQRLHQFRDTYDRFLQEVIERENLRITCGQSCPACCHVVPCGLEPLEIIEIYDQIRQWPDFESFIRAAGATMSSFQKVLQASAQTGKTPIKSNSEAFRRASSDFYLLRIPCIFLNQKRGTCRIYEIRPFICRAVFSLSDAAYCDPKHPGFALRALEVIEPVDEINFVLLETHAIIGTSLGFRFPDILQQGLLAWHRWVRERSV